MSSLTTRQRDLLQRLLVAEGPLAAAELAGDLKLTPRQVNYSLRGLRRWLDRRDIPLQMTPGVGVQLQGSSSDLAALQQEVGQRSAYDLVLTPAERQQLLLLQLLDATEPQILFRLQQLTNISRTTLIKDIDRIGEVVAAEGLHLERRPNSGIWIEGDERLRRQVMARLAWRAIDLGPPIFTVSHSDGLSFSLARDAHLLAMVDDIKSLADRWKLDRTFSLVAHAEAQLDGRFSDDAVLYLALALAIQATRVAQGQLLTLDDEMLRWLTTLNVWTVAAEIAHRLNWGHGPEWPESEVAHVAMLLLAAPRNGRWREDLAIDDSYHDLIEDLLETIALAYGISNLRNDSRLRDGLVSHIIPTCLRRRFKLWMPPALDDHRLPERYVMENKLAEALGAIISKRTGVQLEAADIGEMALLLRAAAIREQPNKLEDVLVICPSGIASAQLLVARLRARFPRLGELEVLSLRELTANRLQRAQLCITTIPLGQLTVAHKVIHVHPLLLPEDVDAITRWLANAG